jgi:formylglycine-generating enzyme required for sulfatase activity
MTKTTYIFSITLMILFGLNCAFSQCGADGTQPCNSKSKSTPKSKPTVSKPKIFNPQPTTTITKKPETRVSTPETRFVPRAPYIEMVKISSGSFMMGSDFKDDEKPLHQVNINYSFYMGKYEVTQSQWKSVMGNNPSSEKGDNLPVEKVSWYEAKEFINKLNSLQDKFKFRLPSEAEWEYSARAGTTGDYYGNLRSIGWFNENSVDKYHPVGQKKPNSFGLYDVLGNAWEWVEDIYDKKGYLGLPTDGSPNVSIGNPKFRVLRSGSAFHLDYNARVSHRNGYAPESKDYGGFRLAADLK